LCIIIVWIVELLLSFDEIKNEKNKAIEFLIYFILTAIILTAIFFFFIEIKSFLKITLVLLLSYFLYNINKKEIKLSSIFKSKFNFKIRNNYLSSFFLNFSAFAFRYQIAYLYDNKLSSFAIFSFTVGGMISTIASNSFGPKHFIDNKNFFISNFLLFFFFSIFFITLLYLINNNAIFADYDSTIKNSLFISVVGGLIFYKSYIYRQNLLFNKTYRDIVFVGDILFSLIMIATVPALFYLSKNLLMYNYLVISIISFIIFYYIKKILFKRKS
jgi:hypothetical protein